MSGSAPSFSTGTGSAEGPGAGFTLFGSPIGCCALVWRGTSIVGAALPDASDGSLRAHLARRFPDATESEPPAPVQAAVEAILTLLSGTPVDLSFIELDISGAPEFDRRVYAAARAIPPGEVRTYGELAGVIDAPGAAQAVGQALGRNPAPIIIPCHRILASAGGSGGFSAPGGVSTKLKMLEIEKARRSGAPELFDHLPWAARPAR